MEPALREPDGVLSPSKVLKGVSSASLEAINFVDYLRLSCQHGRE